MLSFFFSHEVLQNRIKCPQCNQNELAFDLQKNKYRCRKQCTKNKRKSLCTFEGSANTGTFFHNAKISFEEGFLFASVFLMYPVQDRFSFLMKEEKFSNQTITDWSSFRREVCTYYIESHECKIGGKGIIVEIDETHCGKRKHNKGRLTASEALWVFGGIERGTSSSGSRRCFAELVTDRKNDTLTDQILKHVLPGSIIFSDSWKGYNT